MSLAIFIPARASSRIIALSEVAGPNVQMIFVFLALGLVIKLLVGFVSLILSIFTLSLVELDPRIQQWKQQCQISIVPALLDFSVLR